MNVRQRQNLGELLAQAELHLVLEGIDAVLGKATGLDIPIEQKDLVTGHGYFLGGKQTRWACAHNKHSFHRLSYFIA